MNARGGWELIKSTWSSWLQHRGFFFVLAFGWMVPPLVALFVWMAAAGSGQVAGMDRAAFAGYYLVLVLVNQLTYSQTNWTVGDIIREGSLNTWLLRPMAPIFHVLSSETAGKVVYMVFVIPVAALLALLLRPRLDVTLPEVGLFLVSIVFAWALRFCWGLWLALLAFWATRADALLALQDSLIFLLSGIVAPVALLPGGLQLVARVLPFRYMVGFPVEILAGSLSTAELGFGLAVQAAWMALSVLLAAVVWKTGVRHYSAIGG